MRDINGSLVEIFGKEERGQSIDHLEMFVISRSLDVAVERGWLGLLIETDFLRVLVGSKENLSRTGVWNLL